MNTKPGLDSEADWILDVADSSPDRKPRACDGFPFSLIVSTESGFHLTGSSCYYLQILSGLVLRMEEIPWLPLAFPTALESVSLTCWQ